jgi:hypothetical protein
MTRKLDVRPGERYERLTILRETSGGDPRHRYFVCLCDCGRETTARLNGLRSGNTKSCGCLSREATGALNRSHSATGSLTHRRWKSMLTRATNPNIVGAEHYSGRGVTVCERWRTFENFLADMGECPTNHTLDRIDNDKSYQPDNCRWATNQEQARNKHRAGKVRGVQKLPSGSWRVFICTEFNRNLHVSTHETYEEAVAARLRAELEYWGDSASPAARNLVDPAGAQLGR